MKLYHTTVSDSLVKIIGKKWQPLDTADGEQAAYIDAGRVRFILHNPTPEDLKHFISLHVWQCYLYITAEYTESQAAARVTWRRIATETGLKVQERETRSIAAAKKEKRRITWILDKAGKRYAAALDVLKRLHVIPDTYSTGAEGAEIPLLTAAQKIRGGMIAELSPEFKRLINPGKGALIAQIPPGYLQLHAGEDKSHRPEYVAALYAAAWKGIVSYQIPANIRKGTAGRLSNKKLAEAVDAPDANSADVKRHGIQDRIIDRVERIKNALADSGLCLIAEDNGSEDAETAERADLAKWEKTVTGFIFSGVVQPKPRPRNEKRRTGSPPKNAAATKSPKIPRKENSGKTSKRSL